jgi:hypothetical protein
MLRRYPMITHGLTTALAQESGLLPRAAAGATVSLV